MQRLLNAQGPRVYCFRFSVQVCAQLKGWFECVEKFSNIIVLIVCSLILKQRRQSILLVDDLMLLAADIHCTSV